MEANAPASNSRPQGRNTKRSLLTAGLFAAAVAVNTASVTAQQRTAWATRRFGPRAWHAHLVLIAPGWVAFLLSLPGLDREAAWPLAPRVRPVGCAILAASAALWLAAYRQLGPERMSNGYFFGRGPSQPVAGGIFRWLDNPMYDSYGLAFAGAALVRANAAYLLLAAESVVLLNLIEARIENRPFRRTAKP